MSKKIDGIKDLSTYVRNPNKGTERGRGMVEKSLERYGAGRSIVVDADGVAIAGNHVLEAASEMGMPIQVVETDGRTLVVVQRTDLRIGEDKRAVELAYADNRVAEINLDLEPVRFADDLAAGIDLSDFYSAAETEKILQSIGAALTDLSGSEATGGGGGRKESQPIVQYNLVFDSEEQQTRWYGFLRALKVLHPGHETTAGRLDAFLREFEADQAAHVEQAQDQVEEE